MKLAAFGFNKISVEKSSDSFKELKVKVNIRIQEISKVKENILKSKEDLLAINFIYDIDYSEGVAKLEFAGNLAIALDPKESKKILKEWESKKIPEEFRMSIYNLILRKTNVKALSLEEEMGIPYHLQLPFFKKEK